MLARKAARALSCKCCPARLYAMRQPSLRDWNTASKSFDSDSNPRRSTWFLCGNLRKEPLEQPGTVALHGQAEDDGVHRDLCLPLREGVSSAVHAPPSARTASAAVCGDGRRAASGVFLFFEYTGTKTRNFSWHDPRRDRDLLRSLRIVSLLY